MPIITRYHSIFQIEGKHTPCVTDILLKKPRLLNSKKFAKGESMSFSCDAVSESSSIVNSINRKLGKYGYKAKLEKKYGCC